jgi:hypothetical protein
MNYRIKPLFIPISCQGSKKIYLSMLDIKMTCSARFSQCDSICDEPLSS